MNIARSNLYKKHTYKLLLFLILLFSLLLCIIRIKDYGLGFDEILFYGFADININVIKLNIVGAPFDKLFNFYDLQFYGPAYIILADIVVQFIKSFISKLDIYSIWHILNFMVFLLGDWILFVLCKRFVSESASFFATLLYLTQPLLWGHGIMNPKDTPFMVFFLASVTFGLIAFDKVSDSLKNANQEKKSFLPVIKNRKRRTILLFIFALLAIIFVIFSFDRISSNSLSQPLIVQIFDKIQNSNPGTLLYSYKLRIAIGMSHGILLNSYLEKALRWVNICEFYFICFILLFLAIYTLFRSSMTFRWIILAGAVLGLTMSIRVLGPAAAGLVFLYAILKSGKKSIKYLVIYSGVAIIIMYIFWPYLWLDPINRFIQAFRVMADFSWGGSVRFNGKDILPTKLPWDYLPRLLAIQFTLPLVVLALAGIIVAILILIRKKENWLKNSILFLWLLVPILLVIVIKPILYDNFRQFLFITPPLFVFSATGFEKLAKLIKIKWMNAIVCFLLLLPGIISGVWLHPYEYVYYNALVGGTGNTGRTYENDYYGTSLCEAGRYLSEVAKKGSQVAFTNPILSWMFKECADPKMNFQILVESPDKSKISPDYSVVLARYNDDMDYFRSLRKIKTIQRGETAFLVIRSK
ncbi:MAG TPA: hypothetical protein VKF38_14215 [Anaerolineaceae bacterium]|nr:hypothetical protein [Anaerolineaceae bacterium]